MEVRQVDIAVFGGTPLARLVAGLLAQAHDRRVALVGESSAAYRLARGLDLSAAPATRPETWAILSDTVPETLRHLTRLGARSAIQRLDPLFVSATPHGRQALAHVRHMAAGFGHDAQAVPSEIAGANREGLILRDTALILRAEAEPLLDAWLARLDVAMVPPRLAASEVLDDGTARVEVGDIRLEAGMAVLADDAAILAHAAGTLGALLYAVPATAILTEPAPPLASPVLLDVDREAQLLQLPSQAITAVASAGTAGTASAVAALLKRPRPVRLAGHVGFRRLVTRDGAPVLGRSAGSGGVVLAGLGTTGAFLAPAIARWLVGAASGAEDAYFGARGFSRPLEPSPVGEFGAMRPAEAVA
ncbi:hypothetical protein VE25_18695 [Devosia geojensis]|uniref:FAD dependent oxidoreductase domain-containing protein n=1 Tax=Devosia geojensis TaxID=443610 RepID=A0A0F5FI16_9HYPH|nr:hypothetical protein [Devosia geojensis]KKB08448.1 hypothetical protein VE25_18695 [Devosia geojensis]